MLARILPFYITVDFDRKKRRLQVVQSDYDEKTETFTVTAKNGNLVYSSNRPHLRGMQLKHRQPQLQLDQGHLQYTSLVVAIARAIIDHIMKAERQANKR